MLSIRVDANKFMMDEEDLVEICCADILLLATIGWINRAIGGVEEVSNICCCCPPFLLSSRHSTAAAPIVSGVGWLVFHLTKPNAIMD